MSPPSMARFRFPQGGRLGAVVLRLAVLPALVSGAVALARGARAADDEAAAAAAQRRPLTLPQAEESALRYHPTMRQARAQTDADQGGVEQAPLGYLPQVTGTGLYER